MKILTPDALSAAPLTGRLSFPEHTLTVVVKGLFRLEEGTLRLAVPDDELAFPTGDVTESDPEEEPSAIRYASDFVHYKPRADLLLVGRCHTPGGRALPSCPVTFQVGDRLQELLVTGDRWWSGEGGRVTMTEPTPFTEMALGWDRAYGGPACPDNPAGRGHEPVVLEDGREAWPLPNIEFPGQRVGAPEDRPTPAGFGPLAMDWVPRSARSGTYDAAWLRERWPWFPSDLDWGVFNAAPAGMQSERYLLGDEEIYLENLLPERPHFHTRLPGIRVRCFVDALPSGVEPPPRTALEREDWQPPSRDEMDFREVPLNLDTLWVDTEQELVALVWRGYTEVRNEEFAEIRNLFVHAEPLESAPASLEVCRRLFWEALDAEEGVEADEMMAPPVDEASDGDGGAFAWPGEEGASGDQDPDEEEPELQLPFDPEAKRRADLEAMGLDPDRPRETTPEEREQAKEFFREAGLHDLVALLEMVEEEEEGIEPEPPPVTWSREMVEAAHEAGDPLDDLDLRGLDLSGLDLSGLRAVGADFTGADLRDVRLKGADLTRARLVDVDLSGGGLGEAICLEADFSGARLRSVSAAGADFSSAVLARADLAEADLRGAVLEECDLRAAILYRAEAGEAVFVSADFTGAQLMRGSFAGADFSGATLAGVDGREAGFKGAEFYRVRAPGAMLAGANLEGLRAADSLDFTEANLQQVVAADSNWSGATLTRAVLAWAVLDGADFTGANLQGADLYAAHLCGARFSKADLLDARLATANAFEASFDGADLARADLREGNFYGAEFLEARFWETLVDGANLKMTKHG
ncbi:MAG: DUF2169 domain-containing protein [Gemmatimonadales bacterium]|nr:MAG: DUF2169 domain-containing protein [Gemmatimonadales bacterium]